MKRLFATVKMTSQVALLVAFAALNAFGVTPYAIESARSRTATGSLGGVITAATNADPAVMTLASHGFISGDQIQVTGATTLTAINTQGFAKVVSSSTFQICPTSALTSCTAGNGVYDASTGTATLAYLVSSVTDDFTLRFRLASLTSAVKYLVAIQESATGFTTADQRTIWVGDFYGSGTTSIDRTIRKYELPSTRVGTTGVTLRLRVQAIGSGTAVQSFFIEY